MHFARQPPVFTPQLEPKMGSVVQAGVLLLVVVLLQISCMAQAGVVQSCHFGKISPCKRHCPDFCPEIYAPVCVVGRKTPPETFPNRCFAQMHACKEHEVLWVIRNGPCP